MANMVVVSFDANGRQAAWRSDPSHNRRNGTCATTRVWVVRRTRNLRSSAQAEFPVTAPMWTCPLPRRRTTPGKAFAKRRAASAGRGLKETGPPGNQQMSSRPHRRATPDRNGQVVFVAVVPDRAERRSPRALCHAAAFEATAPAVRNAASPGRTKPSHRHGLARPRPNALPPQVNDPRWRRHDALSAGACVGGRL